MSLNRALRFISVISLWSLYVSLLTTHRHQKHGYRNQPCGLSSVFGKHSGQDCKKCVVVSLYEIATVLSLSLFHYRLNLAFN